MKRGAASYSTVGASGGVLSTPVKGKAMPLAATPSVHSDNDEGERNEFRMPDWTSMDPSDWRFYGYRGINVAPVAVGGSLGPSRTPYLSSKSVSTVG